MTFAREMSNDWGPYIELKKVFKDLTGSHFMGGDSQEV